MGLDNVVLRSRVAEPGRAALCVGDTARLAALVPLTVHASPLAERYGEVYGSGHTRTASVIGVSEQYQAVLRLELAQGRFFGPVDLAQQSAVCVLGGTLARQLFGYGPFLGGRVRFQGEWYRVVGVLADRSTDARGIGSLAGRDLNRILIVPISTLLHEPPGADTGRPIDEIWLQLADGRQVEAIGRIAGHTLARLGRGPDQVDVVVPRELLRQRYRTQRTFSVVVGSVAVLSLLVGGIGIMNIMLASVVERTHEIGIRRAVGAMRRDISLQFLVESLLMTLSGGLAGILLGAATSWLITLYAGWTTRLSLLSVVLGLAVSLAVGVGFGLYPARKAAALQPIDALRFE
jgi:putative ABC transport system permease protein